MSLALAHSRYCWRSQTFDDPKCRQETSANWSDARSQPGFAPILARSTYPEGQNTFTAIAEEPDHKSKSMIGSPRARRRSGSASRASGSGSSSSAAFSRGGRRTPGFSSTPRVSRRTRLSVTSPRARRGEDRRCRAGRERRREVGRTGGRGGRGAGAARGLARARDPADRAVVVLVRGGERPLPADPARDDHRAGWAGVAAPCARRRRAGGRPRDGCAACLRDRRPHGAADTIFRTSGSWEDRMGRQRWSVR